MEVLAAIVIFIVPLTFALVLITRRESRDQRQRLMHQIARPIPKEQTEEAEITRDIPYANSGLASSVFTNARMLQRVQEFVWQAGLKASASDVLGLTVLLTASGAVVVGILTRAAFFPTIVAALVFGLLPFIYIFMRRRRRLAAFDLQLPDVLEMLRASLDAGHTLQRALQVASEEFAEPASSELRIVMEQNTLGVPLARALEFMLERVPDENLRFLVVAVRIQTEAGTSLASIIGQLAETIRDRQRVEMKVRILTAQPKLTGIIAGLMPVILILGLRILNPQHVRMLFYDPTGVTLTKIAVGLELAALIVIVRMLRVDY